MFKILLLSKFESVIKMLIYGFGQNIKKTQNAGMECLRGEGSVGEGESDKC